MKTICAMRDVFKAMGNFETAFEKMYQITLNEAMILCALKEASEKVTATNLSKQTELSPSHTSKMLRILECVGSSSVAILPYHPSEFQDPSTIPLYYPPLSCKRYYTYNVLFQDDGDL